MRSPLGWASVAAVATTVNAFSFSAGNATQCDDLTVTWTGGQAPFQLLISPAYSTPINISIPSSAQGSFTTQLNFSSNTKFLLSMSDASGFGSGGISQVLTVGTSTSGESCNTTAVAPVFTYDANSALQQCNNYVFSDYRAAVQPVSIYGLIPDGQPILLENLYGPAYSWLVNVAAGTDIMFLMVDGQGRQGGSLDILTVTSNTDASCLSATSPSSTASPTQSATSAPIPTSTSAGGSNVSIGAVAATVLGSFLALAVLVTLGVFYLRRWRDKQHSSPFSTNLSPYRHASQRSGRSETTLNALFIRSHNRNQPSNTVAYPQPNSQGGQPTAPPVFMPAYGQYEPRPFTLPATSHSHTRSNSKTDPFADQDIHTATSQAGRSKAAMAGVSAYKPTRYILHNDVEEAVPSDEEEDIVELPPQYTDRRALGQDVDRQLSTSHRPHSSGVRRRASGNVPAEDIPVPPLPSISRPLPGDPNWF